MARRKKNVWEKRFKLACALPALTLGAVVEFVREFKIGEYHYDRRIRNKKAG